MSKPNGSCWIHTASGGNLDLADPDPASIYIEDIAHSLSLVNRFTGATRFPLSVAMHCLHVSQLLPPPLQLWGLLHDAAEAFIGDMCSPLKHYDPLRGFREVEGRLMMAIAERFGLPLPEPKAEIKAVDLAVLSAEREQVLLPGSGPWRELPPPAQIVIQERPWREVKAEYLQTFHHLAGQ